MRSQRVGWILQGYVAQQSVVCNLVAVHIQKLFHACRCEETDLKEDAEDAGKQDTLGVMHLSFEVVPVCNVSALTCVLLEASVFFC